MIPAGTTSVAPHLTVRDIDAALAFYEKAFGFEKKFTLPGQGGRTMHAEMGHAGSTIMLGPESPSRGIHSPRELGWSPVSMFVYVPDVDALHARALSAGAVELLPPSDQFFGARTCLLADPDGHQWMFAQHQKDVSPQEMRDSLHGPHI